MDHNDKRNNSVPAGTFGGQDTVTPDASGFDVREDTLPRFTLEGSRPQRQRVRTLLGVPAVARPNTSASTPEPKTATEYESDPARPAQPAEVEHISTTIADTLEVLDPVPSAAAAPEPIDIEIDLDSMPIDEVTFVDDLHVQSLPTEAASIREREPGLAELVPTTIPAVIEVAPADVQPSRTSLEPVSASLVASSETLRAAPKAEPAVIQPPALPAEPGQPFEMTLPIQAGPASESTPSRARPQPSVAPAALSSLAPREVARIRPVARKPAGERSPLIGLLAVAAVMLLATGAWWFTSGTFRRGSTTSKTEARVEHPTPSAASRPVANVAEPANSLANSQNMAKPSEPVVAPPTVPNAASTTPAETPSVAQPSSVDLSRSSPHDSTSKPKPSLTSTSRNPRSGRAPRVKPGVATADAPGGPRVAPSRNDVLQRLESVRPSVRACAAGRSGVADLDITIAHTGSVMHVLVGGDFAGTTEGSCIARAVREARFPSFKQDRFRLLFPYAI